MVTKYGDPKVLQIQEVVKPKINDDEILIRVVATSVTAADSRIRAARFPAGFGLPARLIFGITKPRLKILGGTYSGVVEEVGDNVANFNVGDEVCGMTGIKMGSHAEYLKTRPIKSIAHKPNSVSHEDAAGMLFGGTTALSYVRDKLAVKKGDNVLVNGASGAVGTNAVQLARYFGAHVTAVTSGANRQLVKKIGAQEVIDYKQQDILKLGKKFDVVLDAVGNISIAGAKSLVGVNGRAGLVVANLVDTIRARGKIFAGPATEKSEDIKLLLSLMEQGKLITVVDSIYTINDISKAHSRVDTGKKVGNVIVTM